MNIEEFCIIGLRFEHKKKVSHFIYSDKRGSLEEFSTSFEITIETPLPWSFYINPILLVSTSPSLCLFDWIREYLSRLFQGKEWDDCIISSWFAYATSLICHCWIESNPKARSLSSRILESNKKKNLHCTLNGMHWLH